MDVTNCKPATTPSDINQKLSVGMSPKNETEQQVMMNVPYQEAIGCLLFLVQGTRPDIAYAVNNVSRFNLNHGKAHWIAVKRIFRYLKGTVNYKLKYSKSEKLLFGYSDADWASDVDKRRSCTGYVFKMSNGPISWSSKCQPTVALSSTEAEYMALSSAVQESIWLRNFGQELDPGMQNKSVLIQSDNQSAIALATSDGFRARSKHIDVRHHYIREKIEDNIIQLKYVPTELMVADNLTKAVSANEESILYQECRTSITALRLKFNFIVSLIIFNISMREGVEARWRMSYINNIFSC